MAIPMTSYDSLVEGDLVRVNFLNEIGTARRVEGLAVDVITTTGTYVQTHRKYVTFINRPTKKVRLLKPMEEIKDITPEPEVETVVDETEPEAKPIVEQPVAAPETVIRMVIIGVGESRKVGIVASRGDIAYTHTQPATAEIDWNSVVNECLAGLAHVEATGLPDIQTDAADTVGGAPKDVKVSKSQQPKKSKKGKATQLKISANTPVAEKSLNEAKAPQIIKVAPPADVKTKQQSLF